MLKPLRFASLCILWWVRPYVMHGMHHERRHVENGEQHEAQLLDHSCSMCAVILTDGANDATKSMLLILRLW